MSCNVGGFDRILRIVVGLILLALAITDIVGVWGYIGLIPLLTGVLKFCPVYKIVGINTSK
jgi:hypothetical protein